MGPWAVSADEVGDLAALEVSSTVNGEPRQKAPVNDLIFDVPELIATLSAGITLLPGDVIATGTPAGVGIGFDPPRFLQPGDVVECAITGPRRPAQPHRAERPLEEDERVQVNGKELAVEVDGRRSAPSLLVHGLGGTSNFYQPQADGAGRALHA